MTYFPDLSPYTYYPAPRILGMRMMNVGWLDDSHEFQTGKVSTEFLRRLLVLCTRKRVDITRGWYPCRLMGSIAPGTGHGLVKVRDPDTEEDFILGDAEIWIRDTNDTVYGAPNLVLHYVQEHQYQPPTEFVEATLNGRPIDEEEWVRAVKTTPDASKIIDDYEQKHQSSCKGLSISRPPGT